MTVVTYNDTSSPSYRDADYIEQRVYWDLCQDVKAGTAVLRDKKDTYLPRFDGESVQDWAARVKLTFADNHYDQTLADHVGLVFAKDPALGSDVPEELTAFAENVDGENTHLVVFAKQFFETALDYGFALILTDYPPVPQGKRLTKAEGKAMSLRPYWSIVRGDQVVNKHHVSVGGRRVLTRLVIEEHYDKEDGAFGSKVMTRYRVFRQEVTYGAPVSGLEARATGTGAVTYEVWEKVKQEQDGAESYVIVDSGTIDGPDRIPVAVCYGGPKLGVMRSRPHLLGLAYTNLEETQVKSDYAQVMHKCNVPTPIFIGRPELPPGQAGNDVVKMGQGLDLPLGGDAKMLEPTGVALNATRERLNDIREQLRRQGAWVREGSTGPSMTATEAAQVAKRTMARLVTAARSLEDALEQALADAASFMGISLEDSVGEEGGGSVEVNMDFGAVSIDPQLLTVYTSMYNAGALPLDALLFAAKHGHLPDEFDAEEAALEAEAAEAARVEEQRAQLEKQLAANKDNASMEIVPGERDASGRPTSYSVKAGSKVPPTATPQNNTGA